jgi:hypothetical protein
MTPSKQPLLPPIPPPELPITTPDTPPATSTPEQRYGEIQVAGAIRQRWLEDPTDTTCQIQPSTLTVDDLIAAHWYVDSEKRRIPMQISEDALALGYANEAIYDYSAAQNVAKGALGIAGAENIYTLLAGEGLLVAEAIFRIDGPQFSQIARAQMQETTDPQTLRHFYVCDIVNIDTGVFVHNSLYSPSNGLTWPPVSGEPLIWQYNTPEYQGLLGTRIGKCAVYLVLEIFPRGTYYISRIVTWEKSCSLEIRFDIEPIPPSGSA